MRAIKRPRENEQTAFEIKFLIKQPWIPSQPSLSPVGKEEREGLDTPREEDEKLLDQIRPAERSNFGLCRLCNDKFEFRLG